MKTWQVFFLILAAAFLGVLLFVVNSKNILPQAKVLASANPVQTFINKISEKNTTILLTGDVMLGRSVMSVSLKRKDPSYPFAKVSERLKSADLIFANLETPIIAGCSLSDSGFKFCADPRMVEGLTGGGIDIVNIANNHAGNYGRDGVNQTEKYLTLAGISFVGDNNLVIKEINGTKFGFLGFDYVDNKPGEPDFKFITDSKSKVDVLIVAVHWGVEYTKAPTNGQKLIANNLINAGADVIYGTHPHWIQTVDHINGKPVYYSLGNFIFDQMWSEETRKGLVIRLTYKGSTLVNEEKLPIYMKNFAQPEFVTNLPD